MCCNIGQPYNILHSVNYLFQHQQRISELDGVIAELQKKKDKV